MALVDVGSGELNRRAESRSMTFLHSSEWERTTGASQLHADRAFGEGHHAPDQEHDMSRSAHFYAASQQHDKGVSRGIREQKIPARGIKAENISPKTPLQRKSYGSNN